MVATDHLLTAHVLGYEAIHRARPDAEVTTNNACVSVYDSDRLLTDLLMARALGVARADLDAWLGERRAEHDAAVPPPAPAERLLAAVRGRRLSGYGPTAPRRPRRPLARPGGRWTPSTPAPTSARSTPWASTTTTRWPPGHFRLPGHRTAGGRGGCRPASCGTTSPTRPG